MGGGGLADGRGRHRFGDHGGSYVRFPGLTTQGQRKFDLNLAVTPGWIQSGTTSKANVSLPV